MKPLRAVERIHTPDGRELVLWERDGFWNVRVNGLELMSSRAHGSEEVLAELGLAGLATGRPRVLVAGLGFGYTLRAALDALPGRAEVVLVEVFPEIVAWNRGRLGHLAGRPLDDPRVAVEVGDVRTWLGRSRRTFQAILLDVDNGPEAFTLDANAGLYTERGLAILHRALAPGGSLAVWSAHRDPAFARRLTKAGFQVETKSVRARKTSGPAHTLFLARRR